jgi:hypothetical protein
LGPRVLDGVCDHSPGGQYRDSLGRGAHVAEFTIGALPAAVSAILGAAGAVFAKDVLKEQPLYKALLKVVNRSLQPGLQERAIKALLDVARQLKQETAPVIEEVIEEPPREWRTRLDMGPFRTGQTYEKVYSIEQAIRDYGVVSEPPEMPPAGASSEDKALTSLPREAPDPEVPRFVLAERVPDDFIPHGRLPLPDQLEIESITARHRAGTPARVEARIKRISVKPPPLTYRSE